MKSFTKTLLVFTLAALLASPLMAADDAKKKKKAGKGKGNNRAVAAAFKLPASIQLSADQKGALEKLKSEYKGKLLDSAKKANSVLSAEQRKARAEAVKAAKEAGKKGKAIQEAASAALKLTDEQKSQMAEARKEMASLRKEIRGKISELLTDEQKASLKSKKGAAKKPKKKKAA